MSFSEWQTYKLGELYDVFSGLSKSRSEFGFGNPFVTFKDVFNNYFLPDTLTSLANTTEKEMKSCSVKKGDIFLTRTSETQHELGYSSVALKDYPKATFNGFTKRLRRKTEKDIAIDLLFIGYYLRSPNIRNQISQFSSLTTRASLNSSAINSLEINLPNIKTQIKIGEVLKSLDDKIELNRQTNQTLEAIAQTLFKEMCLPKGDELPAGWTTQTLGSIGKIVCGKTPSKDNKEYFGGHIPFIKIPNMHNTVFITSTEESLTELGANTQSNKYIPPNSIVVSCIATVGLVSITSEISQTNQQINSIVPKNIWETYFLYFKVSSLENMLKDLGSGGSATLNVNTSTFSNIKIEIPEINVLKEFHRIVAPLFENILKNEKEKQTLSIIRDSLLPKLMKGELAL